MMSADLRWRHLPDTLSTCILLFPVILVLGTDSHLPYDLGPCLELVNVSRRTCFAAEMQCGECSWEMTASAAMATMCKPKSLKMALKTL